MSPHGNRVRNGVLRLGVVLAAAFTLVVSEVAPAAADSDPSPAGAESPTRWLTADGGNGHWYQLSPRSVDGIEDAIELAAETPWLGQPGYVVSILSEEEKDFLVDTFGSETLYLIGYTDRDEEGVWNWVSGEPSGYEFWASDEPNNSANEDLAIMNWQHMDQTEPQPPGAWNDGNIWYGPAIFEYEVVDVEAPGVPREFGASPSATPGYIDLEWQRSTDDTGIAEYRVYDRGEYQFSISSTERAASFEAGHGMHWIQMDAVDLVGNVSVRTSPSPINIDTRAPSAPVDVTVEASYISATTRMLVRFTLPQPDDVESCTLLRNLAPANAGTFTPQPDPDDPSQYLVVDWNTPSGAAWFQLTCADAAGNTSVRSAPVFVDVIQF